MKKIKAYRNCLALLTFLVVFSFNCPLFAKEPISRQLLKEKENFYNNQISPDSKLFLDRLAMNLHCLVTINEHTLEILDYLPSITESTYFRFVKKLKKKTKRIIPELTNFKKSGQSIKRFIKEYFSEENDLENDLENDYKQLFIKYYGIKDIDPYSLNKFTKDTLPDGAYHYYMLLSNNLDQSLPEAINKTCAAYEDLAQLAITYKTDKLKKLLPEKILFLEKTYNDLTNKLLEHLIYADAGWARDLIIQIVKLTQQQILFNKNFVLNLSNKLDSMPVPKIPKLPDLQVIAIEMTSKEAMKIGAEINVNLIIKNTGHLTAGPSKAKITLPDGKTKIIDVPELGGGQAHQEPLEYTLSHAGKNEFRVMVNSEFETWESNISNNLTRRALILQ